MPEKRRKFTIKELSQKMWFRLINVIFLALYILPIILIVGIYIDYKPTEITDCEKSYFRCTPKKQAFNTKGQIAREGDLIFNRQFTSLQESGGNEDGQYIVYGENVSLDKVGITLNYSEELSSYDNKRIHNYCGSEFVLKREIKLEGSWIRTLGYCILVFIAGVLIISGLKWLFHYIILGYQPKRK